MKYVLPAPRNWDSVKICNGDRQMQMTQWLFSIPWQIAMNIDGSPFLPAVIQYFGSDLTLCIGESKGAIAVPSGPVSWVYPNGDPVEPECFYIWKPSSLACLKSLVPFQYRRKGESIPTEFPLYQVPDKFYSLPWEIEVNDENFD